LKKLPDSELFKSVGQFLEDNKFKFSWRYWWPFRQTPSGMVSQVESLPKAVAKSDTVDSAKGFWRWIGDGVKNMYYDKTMDHPWMRPKQKGRERILDGAATKETPNPRPKDPEPVAANAKTNSATDGPPKRVVDFAANDQLPT